MFVRTLKTLGLFILALAIVAIAIFGASSFIRHAFAQTLDFDQISDVTGGWTSYNTNEWFTIPASVLTETSLGQIWIRGQYGARTFYLDFYEVGDTSTLLGTVTMLDGWAVGANSGWYFSEPITQELCADGCWVNARSTSNANMGKCGSGCSTDVVYVNGGTGSPSILFYSWDIPTNYSTTTATTTIENTTYLPTNVVITSTLCTEETSTTTGQATTTCTNTLSTTTALTYSLDVTDVTSSLQTIILLGTWAGVFLLVFFLITKFIKGKYGHY